MREDGAGTITFALPFSAFKQKPKIIHDTSIVFASSLICIFGQVNHIFEKLP